ncbi:MAG: glycoside hydrolase family 65 protein, partial [Oscillospiraceae bacterium]
MRRRLAAPESWESALSAHGEAWREKWQTADIAISGNETDQTTIRYNMLQLMQALPPTSRNSIGARGLTGEMYEGCIFWDTEIFMLPFFTFTNPTAARRLLEFRYRTLPEARRHARNNYFEGAMYGWQVSELGIEQTPQGVGAYYSIHIVADIAYAILEYWNATHDEDFMLESGAEILVETARFWVSRVHKNPQSGQYDLLAVRGPNEYDVIVNNNLYTNLMAQQNLLLAADMMVLFQRNYPSQWSELSHKLQFEESELTQW